MELDIAICTSFLTKKYFLLLKNHFGYLMGSFKIDALLTFQAEIDQA